MRAWLSRHWRWVVPVSVVGVAVAAWLAFGYFAVHLLWVDDVVEEDMPVFASQTNATTITAPTDVVSAEDDSATSQDETVSADGGTSEAAGGEPDETVTTTPASADDDVTTTTSSTTDSPIATESSVTTTVPTAPAEPVIVTEASGTFQSRAHPTSGQAVVLGDGTGQRFLRFEDFQTDNGPDLDVYLSAASADSPRQEFDDDFVNLGDLKGNVGAQNYEIPRDVDLDHYSTVVIWCVRFSVEFGVAALA